MATGRPDDIARIAGPESMAYPQRSTRSIPGDTARDVANGASSSVNQDAGGAMQKKRHRGGRKHKKKRNRRQSFIAPSEGGESVDVEGGNGLGDVSRTAAQSSSFYRIQSGRLSNTSLESEALLDHREFGRMKTSRQSAQASLARAGAQLSRASRPSESSTQRPGSRLPRLSSANDVTADDEDQDYEEDAHDRTPLLSGRRNPSKSELSRSGLGYGAHGSLRPSRRASNHSKASSRRRLEPINSRGDSEEFYDVNNPPSVPSSPKPESLNDVYLAELAHSYSESARDAVITIESPALERRISSQSPEGVRRRHTVPGLAERDVCFPGDVGMSELGEGESRHSRQGSVTAPRRRRVRRWPDLEILDEWSREEKEERTQQEVLRAKKISEPVMVGGRLRPGKTVWHRQEDDAPFRFTYFNELLDGTIHARTISDLLQDGSTFQDLFVPDAPELSDDSDDEEDEREGSHLEAPSVSDSKRQSSVDGLSRNPTLQGDMESMRAPPLSKPNPDKSDPPSSHATPQPQKQKRYGPRPTFWLDVLKPTEPEMKALAKTFGIHQLTIEDILMEEPREKVELFQTYYFINYRTFEQDKDSEDYMDPINMYVVVFRDGVITFHNSQSPHPANVRRRIRQLNDYMSPTADWISYAIIDDVTDVYAPLVSQIELEVDEIDEDILYMHTTSADNALFTSGKSAKANDQRPRSSKGSVVFEKRETGGAKTEGESGGDMLRRVGECRKKVMGLYRLLGNKADVIKSFAKRCNEHWEVAPRSEIGLYFGDIQDHIVTMTGSLSHYER